jgi:hypothetical protein
MRACIQAVMCTSKTETILYTNKIMLNRCALYLTHTHKHTPWDVTYQEKTHISFYIPNLYGEFHDMNLQ